MTSFEPHATRHTPSQTRAIAEVLGDAVRFLNHATSGVHRAEGVTYAATVGDVLGSLRGAVDGMDQLLRQLGGCMDDLESSGRLVVHSGPYRGDPSEAVAHVHTGLMAATSQAEALAATLRELHNAMAYIGTRPADQDQAGQDQADREEGR